MEYGQPLPKIGQSLTNYLLKRSPKVDRFICSLVLLKVECSKEWLSYLLGLYRILFHIGGTILVTNLRTILKYNGFI